MRPELIRIAKATLLMMVLCFILPLHADETDVKAIRARLADEQKALVDAKAGKDVAQKAYDAASAALSANPSNMDNKRKLDDAEYALRMADYQLSSATKAVDRTQKKLDDMGGSIAKAPPPESAPAPAVDMAAQKAAAEEAAKKKEEAAKQEAATRLAAEHAAAEKAAAEKAAAEKMAAEEAAKKAAAEKASLEKSAAEEAARKAAAEKAAAEKAMAEKAAAEAEAREAAAREEAAAKKKAAAEAAIDQSKCVALPSAPTHPSDAAPNPTEKAYAQGFVKELNHMLEGRSGDDVPPINPFPILEGTKLNPCEAGQREALHFAYLGNGQYRLETPVLAGQQTFTVPNVTTLQRTIPDEDNGETYVFFLDGREGRIKLSAYKKTLIDTPAQ